MSSVCCRICNKIPQGNIVLTRVNPKGEKGIWECSPSCNTKFINVGSAILHAVEESQKVGELKSDVK